MKLHIKESDMKYKTYKNAERCFDILVHEKGYSREEAQDIIDHMLADYQYNPNSNQTLLSRCRQILSKDEYEAEQEFARKNNPFKRESKYRKYGRRLREKGEEVRESLYDGDDSTHYYQVSYRSNDKYGNYSSFMLHGLAYDEKDAERRTINYLKKRGFTDIVVTSIEELYPEDTEWMDDLLVMDYTNWIGERLNNKHKKKRLSEQDAEIEVKHEGILEVPDGKNVDDLPMSHFEKLAKKKGLSKITKALNNLQVWNKNDDPELSKWAGNMIDKLNKKLKKDESLKLSESYLDYDWRSTYTTKELKEMSAEKLLDLKWYDADFTKAELVAVTDDYNNATRRPLEEFFVGSDGSINTDKWYPVQTKDGLELFMRMNGRSSSIEVVAGMKKIKYGARVINRVVRAGKVTFDSFWTKDDFFKWILNVNFAQD